MLTRERTRLLVGGIGGTVLGYVAARRAIPWTLRELTVLGLGVGMVLALALVFGVRKR